MATKVFSKNPGKYTPGTPNKTIPKPSTSGSYAAPSAQQRAANVSQTKSKMK